MSKIVKIPVGENFGMNEGAKVIFNVSGDQWVEMVVNTDITGKPFTITDTKVSNVFYASSSDSEGYGSFVQDTSGLPATSTFNPSNGGGG